ncbi:hypothetical protein pdam_00020657 [Pocillopora damicornis]|uniref:GAIN-B domain-containing protein n=1 Tax=Pocillopora damicornis TaxID=46731 RepID=A0A3M6V564_POCDA|nr:hypothetical protein pdam_00020657 [Pocillopora damicornis]
MLVVFWSYYQLVPFNSDDRIGFDRKNGRYVGTRMMAAAMDPKPDKLQDNIIVKFRNLKVTAREKILITSVLLFALFDLFISSLSPQGFSEEGCHVVTSKSNSEETFCSCRHLSHFTVLVDYSGYSPLLTKMDDFVLEIITYVGLSLSITENLMTIVAYSLFTHKVVQCTFSTSGQRSHLETSFPSSKTGGFRDCKSIRAQIILHVRDLKIWKGQGRTNPSSAN